MKSHFREMSLPHGMLFAHNDVGCKNREGSA